MWTAMEGEKIDFTQTHSSYCHSYEPDLNCHWMVTGPPDKIIKMRFTSFNLEMRQNDTHQSCWDYVEVRNGDGPFAPQVGVFCGATAPPDLRSSRGHLWVKFFTDSDNGAPGFSAVFTAEDPICGSLVPLNATNITQVTFIEQWEINMSSHLQTLTSPGHGSGHYPAGLSCEWILDSVAPHARISIKVTEMDLEDSPGCDKDSLVIEDIGGRSGVNRDVTGGSGALVLSSLSPRQLDYYWRMVSEPHLC